MTSLWKDDASKEMFVAEKASELSVEITSYNSKWLSQLSMTTERDLFTLHSVFQWNNCIETILKPRNLVHHLLEEGTIVTNPEYF